MVKAVRFHHYGGIDVLQVEDVELRKPAADEALVRVRAAGINPGEANIRTGALEARFPAMFPSGEGSDFAGTILDAGADATGWTAGANPPPARRVSAGQRDALPLRAKSWPKSGLRWGSHDLPPQAGIAVYERGQDGLLAAVRVYDDIEAPVE